MIAEKAYPLNVALTCVILINMPPIRVRLSEFVNTKLYY